MPLIWLRKRGKKRLLVKRWVLTVGIATNIAKFYYTYVSMNNVKSQDFVVV